MHGSRPEARGERARAAVLLLRPLTHDGRLDAVHQARAVRGAEGSGGLGRVGERGVGWQRTVFPDVILEVFPLGEFHGIQAFAVLLAEMVDGRQIPVAQSGRSARLLAGKPFRLVRLQRVAAPDLECDDPLEFGVDGLVGHAPAPRPSTHASPPA